MLNRARRTTAALLDVLQAEGFIRGYAEVESKGHKELEIELKYHEGEPVIRELRGMPVRRIAEVELGDIPAAVPYTERHVNRGAVFFFDAGRKVHELVDPTGRNFVMQAYCVGVDSTLTVESLDSLGQRLSLPDGWSFRTRTLDEDLVVDTTAHVATVVQDELENTYTLP